MYTIYVAEDGTRFASKKDCEKYEEDCKNGKTIFDYAITFKGVVVGEISAFSARDAFIAVEEDEDWPPPEVRNVLDYDIVVYDENGKEYTRKDLGL